MEKYNIIGKIYKTFDLVKIENGFSAKLKVKSNFGGTRFIDTLVSFNGKELLLTLNHNVLIDKNVVNLVSKNIVKNNVFCSDISLENAILIKPDVYNLKIRKIKIDLNSKAKSISIPLILWNENENKYVYSLIELSTVIYDTKEYIEINIKENKIPFKIISNEEVKIY